jgi:DNA-binding XRE family transcriptional regulator
MYIVVIFTEKSHCIVDAKETGNVIKERRQSLKVRLLELSDLAGVDINTLVAIEHGQGNPKLKHCLPSWILLVCKWILN